MPSVLSYTGEPILFYSATTALFMVLNVLHGVSHDLGYTQPPVFCLNLREPSLSMKENCLVISEPRHVDSKDFRWRLIVLSSVLPAEFDIFRRYELPRTSPRKLAAKPDTNKVRILSIVVHLLANQSSRIVSIQLKLLNLIR